MLIFHGTSIIVNVNGFLIRGPSFVIFLGFITFDYCMKIHYHFHENMFQNG